MSREYYRRGRNWYSAIGSLFIVMAVIVLVTQLIVWGHEFVLDFILNSELTREKISLSMIFFGIFMIFLGFRKK